MSTTVRERPIIFSGEMVRALLDGRKTMTRRVVKPQPPAWIDRFERSASPDHWLPSGVFIKDPSGMLNGKPLSVRSNDKPARCPFGQVGSRLWVRETWQIVQRKTPMTNYRADDEMREIEPYTGNRLLGGCYYSHQELYRHFAGWRSPIHMPRWASRITLEITGVRVERLTEITDAGAIAEGIYRIGLGVDSWVAPGVLMCNAFNDRVRDIPCHRSAKDAFKCCWDAINGKRHPWSSNPFVWVLEFKRLQP